MKIGLVYPQTEFSSSPSAIRDYTQLADELGYTHILAYDHVLGVSTEVPGSETFPYTIDHPFIEPLGLFAHMSAISSRLEFATGVIILPQRQTVLFAKQAAVLDLLCNGRLRLGIGLGWNEAEFIALGEDFHTRGIRIEEQVEVLRKLWTEPLVQYSGRWHMIPNAGLNPMPLQRPIPLWFGGYAEPALRRAARLGDGWMVSTNGSGHFEQALRIIHQTLDECGRTRPNFGIETRVPYESGDPRDWISMVEYWTKAGATHLSFNTMRAGLHGDQDHFKAIKRFAEVIHPTER